MPRFYFHLRSPAGLERDEIGLDLEGVEAAYLDAHASIPAMTADLLRARTSPYQHVFEIVDDGDNLLMEVPFSEVLDRGRKPAPPKQSGQRQRTQAEMDRTACLIAGMHVEQVALWATLAETKRLLAETRKVVGRA